LIDAQNAATRRSIKRCIFKIVRNWKYKIWLTYVNTYILST
jgi:hypothetical protein